MGRLSKAMTRMRDEIVISRQSRLAFRGELVRQSEERRSRVAALCATFASDRAGAHGAWFGRKSVERPGAVREQQPTLASPAKALVPPAQQPSVTPEPKARDRVASEPVATPAVRPPASRSEIARRRRLKRSEMR